MLTQSRLALALNHQNSKNKQKNANPRLIACRIIADMLRHQGSLSTAFTTQHVQQLPASDQAFVKMLCFGTMRHLFSLQHISRQLLDKPIKTKEAEVQAALLMGLFQLLYLSSIPAHAAVSTTVELYKPLRKPWARGLLNAILREAARQKENLLKNLVSCESAKWEMPDWLLLEIHDHWPAQTEAICEASLQHPPFCLRVNQQQTTRREYLELLDSKMIDARPHPLVDSAVILDTPLPVNSLPGFQEGVVSIQDTAAQLAAQLLEVKPGQSILDACAAPGGKTGHILEIYPENRLVALDKEPNRVAMIHQNLERLKLDATVTCADALSPSDWHDGAAFDRIIIDAPCSGTGVIRRHPDIKWARSPEQIKSFATIQQQLLSNLWPLLKQEGILLYATCSILPQENSQLVAEWIKKQPDAVLTDTDAPWGHKQPAGRQILPGEYEMDGFYYARICKQ